MNSQATSSSHNHDSWQRRPAHPPHKQSESLPTHVRPIHPNQVDTGHSNGDYKHSTGLGQEKQGGVLTIAAVENPDLSNV